MKSSSRASGTTLTCALSLALSGVMSAAAFSAASTAACRPFPRRHAPLRRAPSPSAVLRAAHGAGDGGGAAASSPSPAADTTERRAAQTRALPRLGPEDRALVVQLGAMDGAALEDAVAAELSRMHPRLVVALQMAGRGEKWKTEDAMSEGGEGNDDEGFEAQMVAVGTALNTVLDTRLRSGRALLADILQSGEVRKLDSTIGKAAKEGGLDMSFFTVLSMNMKDAAMNENDGMGSDLSPTLAAGEGQPEVEGEEGSPTEGASRSQILQHIYTRCQEELEKNVDPGLGLLNKLLRTDIPSIRTNQLQYYLGPQATTITSPSGDTIDLGSAAAPRVSHAEFAAALAQAVDQIRTMEGAGATDRMSAATLVENIRQVAIAARSVLVTSFGEDSAAVTEFQRDLQQVFRPTTSPRGGSQ